MLAPHDIYFCVQRTNMQLMLHQKNIQNQKPLYFSFDLRIQRKGEQSIPEDECASST